MANDGKSRDPRTSLPATIAAVAGANDLDAALEAVLAAADEALGAADGRRRAGRPGPGRPAARRRARHGRCRPTDARGRDGRPDPPVQRGHDQPVRDVRPAGHARGGRRIRRGVPAPARLVRRHRGRPRRDRVRMARPARGERYRPRSPRRRWPPLRHGGRPGPAHLDGRGTLRMVRADGPQRPADRSRQRADGRGGSSSWSSRAPPVRAARCRSRCSTSTASRRPTATAASRRATTSCGAWRRSWPNRSGSSTRSAASAATSSC